MIPKIENLKYAGSNMFFLLAGPCVIESEKMALEIAEKVIRITDKYQIPYIFKASYKKANRSRIDSFTGIGDEKALKILEKVLSGLSDKNLRFSELKKLLSDFGFSQRIKGDHHFF